MSYRIIPRYMKSFHNIPYYNSSFNTITNFNVPIQNISNNHVTLSIFQNHFMASSTIPHHIIVNCKIQHQLALLRAIPHHTTLFITNQHTSSSSNIITRHTVKYRNMQHNSAFFRTRSIIPHHSALRYSDLVSFHLLTCQPFIHSRCNKPTYSKIEELVTLRNHQPINPSSHHRKNGGATKQSALYPITKTGGQFLLIMKHTEKECFGLATLWTSNLCCYPLTVVQSDFRFISK